MLSFDWDEGRHHNKDHQYYRSVSDLLTMALKLVKKLSTRAAIQYLRDRREVLRSGKVKQWSSMMKGARGANPDTPLQSSRIARATNVALAQRKKS